MNKVTAITGANTELGLVHWRGQLLLIAPPDTTEFGFNRSLVEQSNQAKE